ncbi:cytoplasmic protein [Parashewanella hymeniacidonis]|uniref:cytoplasmic protein n=1 Tax=Parashewanella hymeniacidonis TaxID=2807618 RepID=UPI001EF60D5E|nr:cytoplasmic protein [Parashewanella hymeniacidonis]
MNVNSSNIQPNVSNETANTKMLVKAKEHQEMQGEMAMQLIEAASIPPQPVGNSGHIINTKA